MFIKKTIESPNTFIGKPKVTGVTRLNRKAIGILVILGAALLLLLASALMKEEPITAVSKKVTNTKLEPSILPRMAPTNALLPPISDKSPFESNRAATTKDEKTSPEEEASKKLQNQLLEENLKARTSKLTIPVPPTSESRKSSNDLNTVPNESKITDFTGPAADDPNKQVRKENFLKAQKKDDPYLQAERIAPRSPYEIKAGTIIPAVMITGVNSDLPGVMVAKVTENVRDTRTGNHILIPQGTTLVGKYDSQITLGQERVLVVWERLIFEDTSSITLGAMPGTDTGGYAGFHDQVNNHYSRIFGSAILMSMVSAGVQLSQPQQSGNANATLSTGQVLAGALGQQLGQTSNQLIQRHLNIQPTLEIRQDYKFNVIVNKDIVLPGVYAPMQPTN